MEKKWSFIILAASLVFSLIGWVVYLNTASTNNFIASGEATVTVEKDTLQLGEVLYGTERQATYRFTNTGTTPFIIHDIKTSCGCTGAKWDKHPVKPGKSGEIKITFAPNSLGRFIKNVEVHCNIKDKILNLKLCGNVTE